MENFRVRSVIGSVYATEVADRIISVAARNAISIMDSAVVLRVNTDPLQIIVASSKQRVAPKPVVDRHVRQPKTQERKNKPAYVVSALQTAYAQSDDESLFATTETKQLVAMTASKPIFINSRTKE